MKTLPQLLVQKEPWEGILMGNYALVRAMIEAGVRVATTFPGSPTPEIANAIKAIKEEDNPLHFEYSTNEKVALEIAFGASLNGHLSTVFFKSVGLNVAADSAVQLPLLNTTGGMVVVLGDDPGANSSQNEQDNRHFARMAYMPVFEPANPKETYEMYLEACKLSRKHSMPVFFRMTTHVCHARELISFGEIPDHDFDNRPRYDVKNGPYMPLTELVFPLKQKAFDKLDKMRKEAESDFLNPVLSPNATGNEPAKYGVIASSIPALSVLENLAESGANVDLLKLGLSYPWPEKKVRKFLEDHEEVLIVEELDPIFEQELKTFAYDNHLQCRLHARTERDELMRELTPPRTWKMLSRAWPDLFEAKPDFETDTHVPPRIPQMCPGCGHRSAFHAFRDAFDENTITVADIGCHTLGFFEPYAMGEVLLCMGHSTATATGLRLFNEQRKVVCFLGDATFFHAGMPGIANAVNQDVDVTLILMENNTTAMTGHQPLPSAPEPDDVRIPIQQVLEGLGVKDIENVDTYKQKELAEATRRAMDHKGFSVVIARHPCMLQFVRKQRRSGAFKPIQVQVDADACTHSHDCVSVFGCPSFVLHEDGSVTVHEDLCIGDGSCKQTCPVDALVQPRPEVKK